MAPEDQTALTQADEADLGQYGAVSALAIGALVLGVASAVALANLLLLVVPLAAMVTALLALRKIARSEGALVGRTVAVAGLALALVFASIALANSFTRQAMLRSHARALADEWLELVRKGDLYAAHQLHLPAAQRQIPGTPLRDFYARSSAARDEMQAFFDQPPISAVAAAPADASLHYQGVVEYFPADRADYIHLLYELKPPAGRPTRLVVVAERISGDDGGKWRIAAVSSPPTEQAVR